MVIWKKMAPKQGGNTKEVVLLEEVCQCGGGLWGLFYSSFPQCDTQSASFCLQGLELSAIPPASCLLTCYHGLCYDEKVLHLWNSRQVTPIK